MKFVDIKNDIAFRKIFGNDKKTEAYADANQNTWSQAELDAYNYAAMREQDDRGRIAMAEQKAQQKGHKEGEEKKEIEAVIGFYNIGVSENQISNALKIPIEKVKQIIENHKNKDLY
ncbi:MAG: hypothetical protein RL757_2604 [Bacteroidota bacterium]|jgi:predicted transposase YdaD